MNTSSIDKTQQGDTTIAWVEGIEWFAVAEMEESLTEYEQKEKCPSASKLIDAQRSGAVPLYDTGKFAAIQVLTVRSSCAIGACLPPRLALEPGGYLR